MVSPQSLPTISGSGIVKVAPPHGGSWIGLEANQELWMRMPYFKLWEKVKAQLELPYSSGLNVIGNPGIGKTVGGINALAALSIKADPTRVVVILLNHACYIFDGSWYEAKGNAQAHRVAATGGGLKAIASRIAAASGLPHLLLLHDVRGTTFPYQSSFVCTLELNYTVHCVLFTSPEATNYSGPAKDFSTVSHFYMPMWTVEELEVIKTGLVPPLLVTVAERFREVGGVVRRFSDEAYPPSVKAERAEALESNDIQAIFCRRHDFTLPATSTLFQLVPSPDYRRYSMAFLCDEARDDWYAARKSEAVPDALTLLKSAMHANDSADALGRHLGNLVLSRLLYDDQRLLTVSYLGDGLGTSLQQLLSPTARVPPALLRDAGRWATAMSIAVLELPAAGSIDLKLHNLRGVTPNEISSSPGLYVPALPNCRFVDFVLVTASREAWMFQVAVSGNHRPSKAQYDDFMNHFSACNLRPRMVWVGCDRNTVTTFQSCKDDTSLTVPQFSLKLGVKNTEVWVQQRVSKQTPRPTPFSMLLNAGGGTIVESHLLNLRLKLIGQQRKHSNSSPALPWQFVPIE